MTSKTNSANHSPGTHRLLLKLLFITIGLLGFKQAGAQCDEEPELKITGYNFTCKEVPAELKNSSKVPITGVKHFTWDFGDGAVIKGSPTNNSNHWGDSLGNIPGHLYKNDGWYKQRFVVEFNNGTKDTVEREFLVKSSIKILLLDSITCDNEIIRLDLDLTDDLLGKGLYMPNGTVQWEDNIDLIGNKKIGTYIEAKNGTTDRKIVAKLTGTFYQGCKNLTDSIQFQGNFTSISIDQLFSKIEHNEKFQCDAYDTVHFANTESVSSNLSKERLWCFGDVYAKQCTTDTKNGVGVGENCNYSKDSTPFHKYTLIDSIYYNHFFKLNRPIILGRINSGYETFSIDTMDKVLYREAFEKFILKPYMVNVSLNLSNGCTVSDTTYIFIGKPKASNVLAETKKVHVNGNDYYQRIILHLDKTKSGVRYGDYKYSLDRANKYWPDLTKAYELENRNVLTVGTYKAINNEYPPTVYLNASGLMRGSNSREIGIVAYNGVNTLGELRCPDTAWVDYNFYLPDPTLDTIFYESDSIFFRFEDNHRTSTGWGVRLGSDGPISEWGLGEYSSTFEPNDTGSTQYLNTLIFYSEYINDDFSLTAFDTAIVTAVYDAYPTFNKNKISFKVIDFFMKHGVDVLNVNDSALINALGAGQQYTIDTTGYGALIQHCLEYTPYNIEVLNKRDSMLVGNLGNGLYGYKFPKQHKIELWGSPSDIINSSDHIVVNRFGEVDQNESELYNQTNRHFSFIANSSKYGSKLINEKFNDEMVFRFQTDAPENSDTLVLRIKSFYTTLDQSSIDTNRNWAGLIQNGGKESIVVDWDIADTTNVLDTVYTWNDKKEAVFSRIPNTSGWTKGVVITENEYGNVFSLEFNYYSHSISKSQIAENLSTTWSIQNNCSRQVKLVNRSRAVQLDECGIEQTNYDTLSSVVYLWGDGTQTTASIGDSVFHTYPSGTYTLTKIYTTKYGYKDTLTEVYSLNDLLPEIDFDYSVNSDSVYFYGPQLADSLSLSWNFGDGQSSTLINPVHKYTQNKVYNVCLEVTNDSSKCSLSLCQSINPIGCEARYDVVKDSFNQFGIWVVDRSTGSNLSYVWDFGDGDTVHKQYPDHVYADFGKYELCLQVKNSTCKSTYCDSVGMDADGKLLKKAGFKINVVHPDKLGVESVSNNKSDIVLYPNPADDKLFILSKHNEHIMGIRVYDMSGKQALPDMHVNEATGIDVATLEQGLYLIQITTAKGNYNYRVMVE